MLLSYIKLSNHYDNIVTTIHKANELNWMGLQIITQM